MKQGNKKLTLIVILGLLAGLGPLSIDMYLPALPMITSELATTTSLTQLSITACLIGIASGQLFLGPFSDRVGRRRPLIISLTIYIIVSILCVFSPSIEVFVALRFLQGAAGSAGVVLSRAMVRDLYSGTELTKFFALLMLVNGAAPILAPVAGGLLLTFTSWRGIFFTLSVLSAIILFAVILKLQETLPIERRSTGGAKVIFTTFRQLLVDRSFMGYALAQACVMAAMFAYIAGSPFVLQNIFNVSPQMYGIFFAINGIGIILASQITGRLAGHIAEAKMFKFGLFLAAGAGTSLLIAILTNAGLIFVLIPLFFVVSSVGIVNTTSFALAMEKQGKNAGSASALLGVLSFIGGAIFSPLVGIAGGYTALPMAILVAFGDIGALAVYFLFIRPIYKENLASDKPLA